METSRKLFALRVLRAFINTKFFGEGTNLRCLCSAIEHLAKRDILSENDRKFLVSILPDPARSVYHPYCWKPFDKENRIKWIDMEINELLKEERYATK